MLASKRFLFFTLALMLTTAAACKNGKSGSTQSTRWSDLSSNFQQPSAQPTVQSRPDESRPSGTEHFKNVAGPKPPLSLNFQPVLDQHQLEYQAPGTLRLPDDSWIDKNQQWKQHWRENPDDSPVMHKWYKDDFR